MLIQVGCLVTIGAHLFGVECECRVERVTFICSPDGESDTRLDVVGTYTLNNQTTDFRRNVSVDDCAYTEAFASHKGRPDCGGAHADAATFSSVLHSLYEQYLQSETERDRIDLCAAIGSEFLSGYASYAQEIPEEVHDTVSKIQNLVGQIHDAHLKLGRCVLRALPPITPAPSSIVPKPTNLN